MPGGWGQKEPLEEAGWGDGGGENSAPSPGRELWLSEPEHRLHL